MILLLLLAVAVGILVGLLIYAACISGDELRAWDAADLVPADPPNAFACSDNASVGNRRAVVRAGVCNRPQRKDH